MFKVGDIVFVSNPDTDYEVKNFVKRTHKEFFGEVTEVETHENGTTVEVTFNNYDVWYYSPEELSLATDLENMTLKEFSEKFGLVVNAVYLPEEEIC